jgi:hypothetical protein
MFRIFREPVRTSTHENPTRTSKTKTFVILFFFWRHLRFFLDPNKLEVCICSSDPKIPNPSVPVHRVMHIGIWNSEKYTPNRTQTSILPVGAYCGGT